MKRFLIGLVAVAGLVASVLAVATSSASPTSGQAPPGTIILENTAGAQPDARLRLASGVTVTVATVGSCDAGNLAPANNGVFTLAAPARAGLPNAIASTGLLNPRCSWTVSAVNPGDSCQVTITVKNTSDVQIDAAVTTGSVTLSGLNQGPLVYGTGNQPVGNIEFFVELTTCVGTFTPEVTITVPATASSTRSGFSAYGGTEFTVAYSTTQTGCLASGTDTYVVAAQLGGTAAAPTVAVDRKAGTSAPVLISQTRAEAAKTNGAFCSYTFAVTPVLPENTNLRQSIVTLNRVTGLDDNDASNNIATPIFTGTITGATDLVDANPLDSNAAVAAYRIAVTYSPITVPITVTTVFPSDEVFTTADKVDYTITINAPCGGYLGLLPSAYGSQGESASSQVFPGSILVYGASVKPLTIGTTDSRSYSVNAYQDPEGSRPCSVTVTERSGPERCSPVGGAVQTMTYASGTISLAFEFNHTCDAVGGGDEGGDGGSGTPPAPPEIDFGDGGDEATDEATPVGPSAPGFTG